jgi:hypothetical protein
MFIKINNNCLYLPYNSLDRSWFPLFFRINCAKIGVLMYFSNFFEKVILIASESALQELSNEWSYQ